MVRLTGKGTTATEKTVCHAPGSREEGKLHTMQGHVENYQTTQEAQREAETVDKSLYCAFLGKEEPLLCFP